MARSQRNSIGATSLTTRYPTETNASQVWNSSTQGTLATGAGVTVAVVDTGVATHPDLTNLVQVNVNKTATAAGDGHGHGTHVAGIVAGRSEDGRYIGMAPGARIVGVKIADDTGNATESDLLRGLQWCYDHRATHSLDIVTLSVNTGFAESYRTSPVCAAVEQLWFNGIVVICAAGNRAAISMPPSTRPQTTRRIDHCRCAGRQPDARGGRRYTRVLQQPRPY